MNETRPDEELMRQLKADDPGALDALMERYESSVLNTIHWSIGDRQRAEELAQEVFVSVYRERARYQPRAKFTSWLFRIVRNRCLNELRARRRASRHEANGAEALENVPDASTPAPDLQAASNERQAMLLSALAALPEAQRSAFVLAKIEGLSYQEIAGALGISLSACESLIHRARLNLRARVRPLLEA